MGPSGSGVKYVLVLKDDLSGYVWLKPCISCDGENVRKSIMDWISTFTVMDYWISDQGSHFKNKVAEKLSEDLKINHHFVTAYSPWANGTVERVMREIRRAATALLSEFKLAAQDWDLTTNLIQRILNESPLARLGKNEDGSCRTPLQVMVGMRPHRTFFKTEIGDSKESVTIEKARAIQVTNIERVHIALDEMHKDVSKRTSRNRQKHIDAHNQKTGIISPNFNVGDFVIVRTSVDKGHKLNYKWVGPRRITAVLNELVYEVTKLDGTKPLNIHCSRLLIYRENMTNEISEKLRIQADHLETSYDIVDKLLGIKKMKDGIYLQVEWLGLPDPEDFTWQKLEVLHQDIPEMLSTFLDNSKNTKLVAEARKKLNTNTK